MSDIQKTQNHARPILRLRPVAPTERLRPKQKDKQPNGPWIAHPGLIDEKANDLFRNGNYAIDITMKDYRNLWKEGHQRTIEELKGIERNQLRISSIIINRPSVDMERIQGMTDHQIASALEDSYVGAHHYLVPGHFMPPSLIERFGADWGLNARGIYYRHYYSPGWVSADHSLWLPSLDGVDWDHPTEESRRARAKIFQKHVLENEKWKKSEYAWEADAWSDVFGQMRNDPVLEVDKHEYNTIRQKRHHVSCLLHDDPKFIKRIPDATFGLATFQPKDYQNALAEWDLDRDRLEALLLHKDCGLISDPRWGDTNLVFPFAAYEAKGWSGDAREARQQACSAGAAYLDLLDNLARQPGKVGKKSGAYQTPQSRNSQVFVFTSFGAHWHILVGYKRPRLKIEHAGCEGLSESVYLFQRFWSCRVVTERKAWELLSFVDQIHLWGVTDFRDFVIQHLKPWHEFGKKCYVNNVDFAASFPGTVITTEQGQVSYRIPRHCIQLPEWTKYLTEDTREKLEERQKFRMVEACEKYRSDVRLKSNDFPDLLSCAIGGCGPLGGPGYPLASMEEARIHCREIHGADDAAIARLECIWEEKYRRRSMSPYGGVAERDMSGVLSRGNRKRERQEECDNGSASKRRER